MDPQDRRRAAAEAGLDQPGADPQFDRFARLVRRQLGVSTAMVTMVLPDGQHYPGASGLPEPVQTTRTTTFAEAMCRDVVEGAAPVVVDDLAAASGEAARTLMAAMGVRAYAGHPVLDRTGLPLGSVCALHDEPRRWSREDLDTLADLAEAAAAELRLRQERRRAEQIKQAAVHATRRTRLLLSLTTRFAQATTLDDVITALRTSGPMIGAAWTGLVLPAEDGPRGDGDAMHHVIPGPPGVSLPRRVCLDDDLPTAHVARTRQPLHLDDVADLAQRFPATVPLGLPTSQASGTVVVLPALADNRLVGVVVFAWSDQLALEQETNDTCQAIAACVAQGIDRVRVLENRHRVAATLQAAMLTELPSIDGLELAATYSTAVQTDRVGGDWYDAVSLDDRTLLMIGDVTGHDMQAAAEMGQLRSMLRTVSWFHDDPPSHLLRRLDQANHGLAVGATATALSVRLAPGAGGSAITWSSAGHPLPVVLRADRSVEVLDGGPDLLLGIDPGAARQDHHDQLRPGDTLVMHTDGLVEARSEPYARRLAALWAALVDLAACPTAELPRALVDRLVPTPQRDDVAVLVARLTR